MGIISDLAGTLLASFRFGPKGKVATLDFSSLTANRTLALQDKDGTFAMLSDISGGSGGGGMMVLKQARITVGGTWTPPAGLVAQGGHCRVIAVGGGGGGFNYSSNIYQNNGTAGGSGGEVIERVLAGVTSAISITVGAGGSYGYFYESSGTYVDGSDGSSSAFGTLVTARGGKAGVGTSPAGSVGVGSGHGSSIGGNAAAMIRSPGSGLYGFGAGGGNGVGSALLPLPANSGFGGFGTQAGAAGIIIVEWWQAA